MNYFKPTADARGFFQSNSSAGNASLTSTAVSGNLSDLMRNATVVRLNIPSPRKPTTCAEPTRSCDMCEKDATIARLVEVVEVVEETTEP